MLRLNHVSQKNTNTIHVSQNIQIRSLQKCIFKYIFVKKFFKNIFLKTFYLTLLKCATVDIVAHGHLLVISDSVGSSMFRSFVAWVIEKTLSVV